MSRGLMRLRHLAQRLLQRLGWRHGNAPDMPDFRLMRWFSMTSLVAITIFSIGMALLLTQFLESRMLRHDAELSRDFVQSIVSTQSLEDPLRHGGQGDHHPPLDQVFMRIAEIPDVLRANIYARSGKVLWSSNPAMIGRVFAHNDELEQALTGKIVIARAEHDESVHGKTEHLDIDDSRSHFVENYLPIYGEGDDTRPVAVVELYRVPARLNDALAEGQRLIWAGALIGGMFLYVSTLGLVARANTLLQNQRQQLIEAQASIMVGEISAAVAHSVRNPLASIRSSAELQRELGELGPEVANEMMQHVDRIEYLLRTLLSYTSNPTESSGHVALAEQLDLAQATYAPVFQQQGKGLQVEAVDAGLEVGLSAVLVQQILNSLLANALEATQPGGQVSVRVSERAGSVQMEVVDDGEGMDAAQLAQVFKPFFTTKPRGLGMGLALVRRILSRQGGSISIDSRRGAGTRVLVSMPLRPR
ncbi:MAG: hypothetical protein RJA44_1231 [Pseudomonadota bacterium]